MKRELCLLAAVAAMTTLGCDQATQNRLKDGRVYLEAVGTWRVESFTAKPTKNSPLAPLGPSAAIPQIDLKVQLALAVDGTFVSSFGALGQTLESRSGTWSVEGEMIRFSDGSAPFKLRGNRLIRDDGPFVLVLARQ